MLAKTTQATPAKPLSITQSDPKEAAAGSIAEAPPPLTEHEQERVAMMLEQWLEEAVGAGHTGAVAVKGDCERQIALGQFNVVLSQPYDGPLPPLGERFSFERFEHKLPDSAPRPAIRDDDPEGERKLMNAGDMPNAAAADAPHPAAAQQAQQNAATAASVKKTSDEIQGIPGQSYLAWVPASQAAVGKIESLHTSPAEKVELLRQLHERSEALADMTKGAEPSQALKATGLAGAALERLGARLPSWSPSASEIMIAFRAGYSGSGSQERWGHETRVAADSIYDAKDLSLRESVALIRALAVRVEMLCRSRASDPKYKGRGHDTVEQAMAIASGHLVNLLKSMKDDIAKVANEAIRYDALAVHRSDALINELHEAQRRRSRGY